jgi:hypothetical protein
MRLVSFVADGGQRLGLPVGKCVIAPQRATGAGLVCQHRWFWSEAAGRRVAERLLAEASPTIYVFSSELTLAAPRRPSTVLCSDKGRERHHDQRLAALPCSPWTTSEHFLSYVAHSLARNAILEKLRTD